MLLADPRFIVAQLVHKLREFEIARYSQRRVLVDRMKRGDEGTERQCGSGQGSSPANKFSLLMGNRNTSYKLALRQKEGIVNFAGLYPCQAGSAIQGMLHFW